ncbi:MAG: membrane dipeptidase [Candidatus Paceibacterota bacterium]
MNRMYADAMVFADLPGRDPVFCGVNPREDLALGIITVAHPHLDASTTLNRVRSTKRVLLAQKQPIKVVESKKDLCGTGEDDNLRVVMNLQGCPADLRPNDVRMLFEAGVRVMGLQYSGAGPFGGSSDAPNEPLTDKGRAMLDTFASVGMILDLSHLGTATVEGVLTHLSRRGGPRVMISHTGMSNQCNHPRNVNDVHMKEVANLGGIVGIYSLTFGLSPEGEGVHHMCHHLMCAINRIGAENVCIGSDGWYRQVPVQEWKNFFLKFQAQMDPDGKLRSRFPDQPYAMNRPCRLLFIEEALKSTSLIKREVRGVMGENLHRFLYNSLR